MTYKYLFFDLDDTLLDFQATEKFAINSLFKELNLEITSEIEKSYSAFNQSLWKKYEKNEITKDFLLTTRFSTFFKNNFDMEVDGLELWKIYSDFIAEGHNIIFGADKLLESLSTSYNIYAATNGMAKTQRRRLAESHLDQYFDDIFISDEIGVNKPNIEYFNKAFSKIKNFKKEDAIIIGDSLSSDIQGGNNAGIDTLWYNPTHQVMNKNVFVNYEVDSLSKITNVFK